MKPSMPAYIGIVVLIVGVGQVACSTAPADGDTTPQGQAAAPEAGFPLLFQVDPDWEGPVPRFDIDPSWPRPHENWLIGHTTAIYSARDGHMWMLQRPQSIVDDEIATNWGAGVECCVRGCPDRC